jgi:hypothetical protein
MIQVGMSTDEVEQILGPRFGETFLIDHPTHWVDDRHTQAVEYDDVYTWRRRYDDVTVWFRDGKVVDVFYRSTQYF